MSAIIDLVSGIFGGLGKTAIDVRTAVTGKSPDAEAKLQELILQIEAQKQTALVAIDQAQIDVNKVEAASPSLFKSGWRPAVGWICTLSLGFHVLLKPLVEWGFTIAGGHIDLPTLDTNTVFTLLFSLLGLGSLRTAEKFKGVATK